MDLAFQQNEDRYRQLLSELRQRLDKIHLGGGMAAQEKQRQKNKLPVRERIECLIDPGTEFLEIGALAGYEMFPEHGGCPAGGTIGGIGIVKGRTCMIVANDATVKAGAWFPITGKKNLRLQEIAMENHLPVIYLVDSAGIYLPLQEDIFADKEHFGRVFRNNARMSAMGIPQIAAVLGPCVAGGAYLPIMSDETYMVEGNGSIYLAGPYLVKAAIGEVVEHEKLGGAETHTTISGIADRKFATEKECLQHVRETIGRLGHLPKAGFDRIEPKATAHPIEEIHGLFPTDGKPYDMQTILERLVDEGSYLPFKPEYGQTILCGYARIEGWSVGIVANQRKLVRTRQGEQQMGGVIYNDSADKAARFILNCNQKRIPLLFLQDVTGFMVGSRSEHSGIIKDGAKLVNAVANSVVPKFTIIVGNSFGAGNYAMCGKAYDPRLILAWPTAKIAVMSGDAAAKTLLQIETANQKSKGKTITEAEEKELGDRIRSKYEAQTSPYYGAARLWVDAIIDPTETRKWIAAGIQAADCNPHVPEFKTGVFQV
jgi:3-methylcrotonyl-CoA carboxylase beta subunit